MLDMFGTRRFFTLYKRLSTAYGILLFGIGAASMLLGAFGTKLGLSGAQATAIAGPILEWTLFSVPIAFFAFMTVLNVAWASFWRQGYLWPCGWQFWWRIAILVPFTCGSALGIYAIISYLTGVSFSQLGTALTLAINGLTLVLPWILARYGVYIGTARAN
jgi:hypothetical protein